MIQEQLGDASLIGGERNISLSNILEASPSPSPSPSPSSSSAQENNQNLRCPRCDSSNTKFCYYNNYNLTQPRHFCKTCRRYWTKGGALRNVPIGGGCRKNTKNGTVLTTTPSSSLEAKSAFMNTPGRFKSFHSTHELEKQGLNSLVHELPNSTGPIMWAPPQNSHILALLRANQNQNQNPNPNPNFNANPVCVKEESFLSSGNPFYHVSPMWRGNLQQQQQQQQQQNGFVVGEVHNTGDGAGVQEMYQRLRSSSAAAASYYNPHDHSSPVLLRNIVSSSSSSTASTILESAPVAAAGELGYWNPTLSWSDHHLPSTTNGTAYP